METKDLGKRDLKPGELDNPNADLPPQNGEKDPNADNPSGENKGAGDGQGKGSEKKVEYTPRETQLYTRATSAEDKLKIYREKFGSIEDPAPEKKEISSKDSPVDPFSLAKTVASLRDYDVAEIDFAATISKAKGIPPEQAVQTPDFKLWLAGKRDQDYKNNKVPAPGGAGGADKSIPSSDEIAKMSPEQHKQFEKDFQAKARNKGSGL